MRDRLAIGCTTLLLLTVCGCHRRPVKVAVVPPPLSAPAGPVMVSVPPPTHRSTSFSVATPDVPSIPVVQPVPQPRKKPRRTGASIASAVPQTTPPAPGSTAATPSVNTAQSLGQLTTGTENPSAARSESEQALRAQVERISTLPSKIQAAHPAEVEQARHFLKTAADSWKAADYAAASALVVKAKVLLDDLLKS